MHSWTADRRRHAHTDNSHFIGPHNFILNTYDLGLFWPFFDQNGPKKAQMGTKIWKYREIEFIFGFSTQKLVLNDI